MSELLPEAALALLSLISTDEPFGLCPGNNQPAPTLRAEPLMNEVQMKTTNHNLQPPPPPPTHTQALGSLI